MRVFITGGTGFLGKNLIPRLVQDGYRVRLLVRQPAAQTWLKAYASQIEVFPGALEDAYSLQAGMAGCTHVIHAGGLFRMWGSEADFYRVNVEGTQHVIDAALHNHVQRLIHISTIAVIGNPVPGMIVDENHPPHPATPYQRSKLAGEQLVCRAAKQRGLNAVILRPGAFYGPHGHYAFNRLFFEDPLKGLLIKVHRGRRVIFPTYIEDIAAAAVQTLTQGEAGEIYNICGTPLTHNEINRIVSQLAGITTRRLNAPAAGMLLLAHLWTRFSHFTGQEPYYPINLRTYVFNDWHTSNLKARQALDFRPTAFEEGARRTLDWYRQAGYRWAQRRDETV
ncbi:MAG: NAD-dependent epimerase/dehydratase family protein [Anaerolineae bacterium]|nr:NAD-dependent epimerase/dehydratase family protein [Anaerolineae bacterium]